MRDPILIVVAVTAVMILLVPSTFIPVLTIPVEVVGGTITGAFTVTVRVAVLLFPAASVAE